MLWFTILPVTRDFMDMAAVFSPLHVSHPRAKELLPKIVEKDFNWIDVQVVGINDMTFTRCCRGKSSCYIYIIIIMNIAILIFLYWIHCNYDDEYEKSSIRMDSGLLLSLLEPVAAEYCNQTVNLSRMMTNDHNNDYKEEDNDHNNDYKDDDQ